MDWQLVLFLERARGFQVCSLVISDWEPENCFVLLSFNILSDIFTGKDKGSS